MLHIIFNSSINGVFAFSSVAIESLAPDSYRLLYKLLLSIILIVFLDVVVKGVISNKRSVDFM